MPFGSTNRRMPVDEAYTQLAAMLEEGADLSGSIVALDHFFEGDRWAHMKLRPRQRLLARVLDAAAEGQPLNSKLQRYKFDKRTTPKGFSGEKLFKTSPHCTSKDENGDYWYDEHADWEYLCSGINQYARVFENLNPNSTSPRIIVLIIGRGGGKTTLAAGISAHLAHKVLSHEDPHGIFDLEGLKPLRIQNAATSLDQAGEFFDAFCTFVDRVKWFKGRHSPPKRGMMKLGKHLWAEKSSSNSRSARGRDTIAGIFDEIAFADKTAGPRSDRKLYTAIQSGIKTRAKGKGLVFVLSSPAEADGILYDLFLQGMQGELENSLVIQLASWEMIPGETKEDYTAEFKQDEDVAETEFGAQFFSGSTLVFPHVAEKFDDMASYYHLLTGRRTSMPLDLLSDEKAFAAWREKERLYDRVLHVDTSEGGDGLSLVMTHIRKGMVVCDLARVWQREVGYTKELLPFIRLLSKLVPIAQVSFDQFSSIQLIQDLEEMGIEAVKTAFSDVYNNDIARNMRQVVFENRLALPALAHDSQTALEMWRRGDRLLAREDWDDDPNLWPAFSQLLLRKEMSVALKTLTGRSRGKRKTRLIAASAPTAGPVQTDDLLDSLMSATYQSILRAGGAGVFFTIAHGQASMDEAERKLARVSEITAADKGRDVYCPLHRGYVRMDTPERVAKCPECNGIIQVRM